MDAATIRIVVEADAAGVGQNLSAAEAEVKSFGDRVTGALKGIGSAAAGLSIGANIISSAGLASGLRSLTLFSNDATARLAKVGNAMTALSIASKGLLIGAAAFGALAVGLGLALAPAIQFESAFAGVKKTVDGTPEQLAAISSGLQEMATRLPGSAAALADVAANAGQLGVAAGDVLLFTETVATLAATTDLSLDAASETLAQFFNITGGNLATELTGVADVIVTLGNNMATTESQIVSFATRIAGAGTLVGLDEGEILAIAAAYSSLGLEAEAGGTAVSRVLREMSDAAATGGAQLEIFAETAGLLPEAFARLVENDPAAALLAFEQGLGGIIQSGGNVLPILNSLGLDGIRVSDALLRGALNSELLAQGLGLADGALQNSGAAAQELSVRLETTATRLELFKDRLLAIGIAAGTPLLSTFAKAIDGIGDAIAAVVDILGPAASEIFQFFSNGAEVAGDFITTIGSPVLAAAAGILITLATAAELFFGALNAGNPAVITLTSLIVAYNASAILAAISSSTLGTAIGVMALNTGGAVAGMLGLTSASTALQAALAIGPLVAFAGVLALVGKTMLDLKSQTREVEGAFTDAFGESIQTGNLEQLAYQIDVAKGAIDGIRASQDEARASGISFAAAGQLLSDGFAKIGISASEGEASIDGINNALESSNAERYLATIEGLVAGVGRVGPAFEISAQAASDFAVEQGLIDDLLSDNPAVVSAALAAIQNYNDVQVDLANSLGISVEQLDAMQSALGDAAAAYGTLDEAASAAASSIEAFKDPAINASLSVIELQGAVADFKTQAAQGFGSVNEAFVASNDLANEFLQTMNDLAVAGELDDVTFNNLKAEFEGLLRDAGVAEEVIRQLSDSLFSLENKQILIDLSSNAEETQREIDAARDAFNLLDGTEATVKLELEEADFRTVLADALLGLEAIDGATATGIIAIDSDQARQSIGDALVELGVWDESEATAFLQADDSEAKGKIAAALVELGTWDATTAVASLGADDEATDVLLEALGLAEDFDSTEAQANAYMDVFGLESIQQAVDLIALLQDKTVAIGFNVGRVGGGGNFSGLDGTFVAHGGILQYAAGGGDVPNGHQAQLTRPGSPIRVWSEPETQGELYVPFANDWRRPRAKNLMRAGARKLGMGPKDFASGGIQEYAAGGMTGGGIQHFAGGGTTFATQIGLPTIAVTVDVNAESLGQVGIDLAPVSAALQNISTNANLASGGVDSLKDSTDQAAGAFGLAAGAAADVNRELTETAGTGPAISDGMELASGAVSKLGEELANTAESGLRTTQEEARNAAEALEEFRATLPEVGRSSQEMATDFLDNVEAMRDGAIEFGRSLVEDLSVDEFIELMIEAGVSAEDLGTIMEENGDDIGKTLDDLIDSGTDLSEVFIDAFTEAADATDILAVALEAVEEQFDDVTDALGDLESVLDLAYGTQLNLIDAEFELAEALRDAAEAAEEMEGSYDGVSESSQDLFDAFTDVAEASNEVITSMIESGASAEEVNAKVAELSAGFVQMALDAGLPIEVIELLLGQFLNFPPEVVTEIVADAQAANESIDGVVQALEDIPDETESTIKADGQPAIDTIGEVVSTADKYKEGQYEGTLTANGEPASGAISAVVTEAEGYANGTYTAPLTADGGLASTEIANTAAKATEFANGTYKATLTGDPGPANTASQSALDGANKYGNSGPHTTTLNAVDNASGVIQKVIGLANSVPANKTTVINTIQQTTFQTVGSPPALANAAGGLYGKAFAAGGIENHVAQIAPAGAMRLWAEQETGGEGYIPLANDWRRPRAENILSIIAEQFGGQYVKAFADGGFSTAPTTRLGSTQRIGIGARHINISEGAFQFNIDGSRHPEETARTVRTVVDRALDDFARDLDAEFSRR